MEAWTKLEPPHYDNVTALLPILKPPTTASDPDYLKLADALPSSVVPPAGAHGDILNALLALGYNDREAAAAMKQLPADVATSDGIRQALKLLSRV